MATGNMIRELKLQLITQFLEDQKKHLQRTGASTSLKSIVNLFSLHRCEETSVPSVRAEFISIGILFNELLIALPPR